MTSAIAERTSAEPLGNPSFLKLLWSGLRATFGRVRLQKKLRLLRIQETLPLGEHRFLAVVQWEGEKLLLGVTPQSISLLEPSEKKEVQKFAWEETPVA